MKKWLEALKVQSFNCVTFKYFLDSFKVVAGMNYSADTMRSMSLFVTYAIHKPRLDAMDLHRGSSAKYGSSTPTRRETVSGPSPKAARPIHQSDLPEMSHFQVALGVLELYTDILCQKNEETSMKKFARTVTNKVRDVFFLGLGDGLLICLVAPFPTC